MPEQSISSVDYQKAVGRFGREALQGPIKITHHGRDSLVLMSIAEYDRLKRSDRRSLIIEDFTDEDRARRGFKRVTRGKGVRPRTQGITDDETTSSPRDNIQI